MKALMKLMFFPIYFPFGLCGKVRKKFTARVMFVTGHSVICKITDGEKKKKRTCLCRRRWF